jgi:group I intron endonuclease
MCKGGVYCIVNTINNKKYIGSTKCFKSRFSKHKSDLLKKKHHSFLLQRSWDKYGSEAFEFKILEEVSDCLLYKQKEQHYLDTEDCHYNLDKQVNKGMLGKKHSDETKVLIAEANKMLCGTKNHMYGKSKELHHNYGKKMPQNGRSGKEHHNYGKPSYSKKAVLCYDLDDNFIAEYSSSKEAAEQLNINLIYLRAVCGGKYKSAKEYKFKYKDRTS